MRSLFESELKRNLILSFSWKTIVAILLSTSVLFIVFLSGNAVFGENQSSQRIYVILTLMTAISSGPSVIGQNRHTLLADIWETIEPRLVFRCLAINSATFIFAFFQVLVFAAAYFLLFAHQEFELISIVACLLAGFLLSVFLSVVAYFVEGVEIVIGVALFIVIFASGLIFS